MPNVIMPNVVAPYNEVHFFQDGSSSPTPGVPGTGGTGKEKDTQREILQERIDLYKVNFTTRGLCYKTFYVASQTFHNSLRLLNAL
jgi:hypothetical protein